MHNVTQSLEGRAAVLSLLPFSISEAAGNAEASRDAESWLQLLSPKAISK